MTLRVRVKTSSPTSSFEEQADGVWIAKLKSPPVDGRANRELIALVAAHFGCGKAAVTIKSGLSGRIKLVEVDSR